MCSGRALRQAVGTPLVSMALIAAAKRIGAPCSRLVVSISHTGMSSALFRRGLVLASGFEVSDDAPGLSDRFEDTLAGLTDQPEYLSERKWAKTPRFYTWLRHALHNLDTILWKRLELLESVEELATAAIAMTSELPKSDELTRYFELRLQDADLSKLSPSLLAGFALALARLELPSTHPIWEQMATSAVESHERMEASQKRKVASALAWAGKSDAAAAVSEPRV